MTQDISTDAPSRAVQSALRTIATERSGLDTLIHALETDLAEPFARAVEILRSVKGRVIVTGMGKSGHIGTKTAATLASTGTPAFFVHPSEANHGDLGMIGRDDAVIAVSRSGETLELNGTLNYCSRFDIPLIGITCVADSTLGRFGDVVLALPQVNEACPHNLAPTTSALMQLAIGDALAVALLEARGFTAENFSVFHPGGSLGAQLVRVRDIMHSGSGVPLVPRGAMMTDAIRQISSKGFGCTGVVEPDGRLAGIITDGDLARNLSTDLLSKTVDDVMTSNPKTVSPETLATEALGILDRQTISALIVLENERPVGIVHFHDLLRLGAA